MIQQSGMDCLGTCHKFSLRIVKDDPEKIDQQKQQRILKTRIARGTTYAYLQGCPSEKGCTIVLRGANRDLLNEVKNIISFGILVAYHLRLEVAYYIDRYAILPSAGLEDSVVFNDESDDEIVTKAEEFPGELDLSRQQVSSESKSPLNELKSKVRRSLLSTSLDVDFSLPYASEIRGISRFRSVKANLLKTSPLDHQMLVVSSILMHDSTQRSKSEIKGIKYYTAQDISLGQFLIENCFNVSRNLSRETTMLDQTLTFIHRPGRIEVNVTSAGNATLLDENSIAQYLSGRETNPRSTPIYMSSFCKLCGVTVAPETAMSDETWKMSFGKFLEISLYNRTAKCRLSKCAHNLRDDHIMIFNTEHYMAKFQFIPIHPFSLYIRQSMDFQPKFHLQQAYRYLLNLPHQYAIVVDNFRKSLYLLACETKDIFSGKAAGNEEHQAILNDVANIDVELQSAVASLTTLISNTLSTLPPNLLEDLAKIEGRSVTSSTTNSPTRQRKQLQDSTEPKQESSLDIKLKYPMYHRRYVFMQMMSWNSRIQGLAKYLESIRESIQLINQQVTPVTTPQAAPTTSFMASHSDYGDINLENYEHANDLPPLPTTPPLPVVGSQLHASEAIAALSDEREDVVADAARESGQADSSFSASADAVVIPVISNYSEPPHQEADDSKLSSSMLALVASPVSPPSDEPLVVTNASIMTSPLPQLPTESKVKQVGFDIPTTLESIGIPISKSVDNKPMKQNRLTKALARFVMGKDNYEEDENKFGVNFGELGDGRLGMPPGRKGEVIPVLDEEPGTIIAYSLASAEYYDLLCEFMHEDYEGLDSEDEFEPVTRKKSDANSKSSAPRQLAPEELAGDDMHVDDEDDADDDQEIDGEGDEDNSDNDDDADADADEARDRFESVQTKPNPSPRSLAVRDNLKTKGKKKVTAVSKALANAKTTSSSSLMEETSFTTYSAAENVFHLNERFSSVDLKPSALILEQPNELVPQSIIREDSDSASERPQQQQQTTTSPNMLPSDTSTQQSLPSQGSKGNTTNPSSSSARFEDSRRHQLEKQLLSQRKSHIKHRFEDHDDKGNVICKYQCQTYWSTQFEAVRAAYLTEDENEQFIRSLSMTKNWLVKGGKSGASFSKTLDDRFVIKVINRVEMQMFLDFAPAYFEYMVKACFHNLPTVLCKILGVYTVGYHNRDTGKKVKTNSSEVATAVTDSSVCYESRSWTMWL
jgi:hypothetical protein